MQIINDPSFGELFGKQLGTGLGSALQGLAHQKVNALQRQHSAQTFQQGGYNPETANILSLLAEQNPQKLPEILAMLGAGQGQQGEQQQEGQTPNFAESIGRSQKLKQELSPAQEKLRQERKSSRDSNLALYRIASGLEDALNEGINLGIGPDLLSRISGTQLAEQYGEPTASFSRLANDFVIAKGEAMKGPLTKGKQQLLERSKVGLDKSESVNRQYIRDVKKEAIRSYKEMIKEDPSLAIPEIDAEINGKQLPPLTPSKVKHILATEFKNEPASNYDEGDVAESNEGYHFIVKNGEWMPYQEGE